MKTWLEHKSMRMRVLNDKIDFTKFDKHAIRQSEAWLNSIKLKAGTYTDLGYRLRENVFNKDDHWFP